MPVSPDKIKEKFDALNQANMQAQTSFDKPMQVGLIERLRNKRNRYHEQVTRGVVLEELINLLDENPKVARILELMDQAGQDVY